MATILKVIVIPLFAVDHEVIISVTAMPVLIENMSIICDILLMHSAPDARVSHRCGTSPCLNLSKIFLSTLSHTILHETSVGNILENIVGNECTHEHTHEFTFTHLPFYYGLYSIKRALHTLILY